MGFARVDAILHEWTVNTVDGRGPGVLGYIQRMLTGRKKR